MSRPLRCKVCHSNELLFVKDLKRLDPKEDLWEMTLTFDRCMGCGSSFGCEEEPTH